MFVLDASSFVVCATPAKRTEKSKNKLLNDCSTIGVSTGRIYNSFNLSVKSGFEDCVPIQKEWLS